MWLKNDHTIEIALQGRGGHGVKTAGDILTNALYQIGLKPHGQPRYTPDRRGAPVSYAIRFNRDHSQIFDRSWIKEPKIVVLFDLSLISQLRLAESWKPGITVVLNSRNGADLRGLEAFRCACVDATRIAQECGLMYGCVPMLSSAMLGAFCRVSGLLELSTLLEVWRGCSQSEGRSLQENLRAIRRGYEEVRMDPGKEGTGRDSA